MNGYDRDRRVHGRPKAGVAVWLLWTRPLAGAAAWPGVASEHCPGLEEMQKWKLSAAPIQHGTI